MGGGDRCIGGTLLKIIICIKSGTFLGNIRGGDSSKEQAPREPCSLHYSTKKFICVAALICRHENHVCSQLYSLNMNIILGRVSLIAPTKYLVLVKDIILLLLRDP